MGPIIVVCYTNHALDQFLEGIIPLFDDVKDKNGLYFEYFRHEFNEVDFILNFCHDFEDEDEYLSSRKFERVRVKCTQKAIVRIGGGCKSKTLERFSLRNVTQTQFNQMPEFYHHKRIETKSRIQALEDQKKVLKEILQVLHYPEGILKINAFINLPLCFFFIDFFIMS